MSDSVSGPSSSPFTSGIPPPICTPFVSGLQAKLDAVGDEFGVEKRYTSYDDLLGDPEVDAVHINSPIPNHAEQTLKALRAGKHVACTVPMATSVEDCAEIVKVCRETGLKYMMMETVVYAREFLFVKELYEKGELGKVQFLKASHQQDMEGWPDYWPGLPPMHYATHCVGPVAGLLRLEAEYVSCFGSGTISEDLAKIHNSPLRYRVGRTSSSGTATFRLTSTALYLIRRASTAKVSRYMAARNRSSGHSSKGNIQ